MKNLIFFLLIIISLAGFAQQKVTRLVYHQISNGNLDTSKTHVIYSTESYCFTSEFNAKIKGWIDFERGEVVDIMEYDGVLYKTVKTSNDLPEVVSDEESEKMLKYDTRKRKFLVFSNTVEVWYNTKSKVKGGPYKDYVPQDALVLKVLINGKNGLQLAEIDKKAEVELPEYKYEEAKTISQPEARELQIKSRYVNFPVFDKAQINWGDSIVNTERDQTNVLYRFGGGTVILKKVKLPEINKQGSQIFATITNWSNGDAYDRTGCLFTISGKKDKTMLNAFFDGLDKLPVLIDNNGTKYQGVVSNNDYETPVELVRFFTSFGVNHFNNLRPINNYNWHDSVVYKQEITDLIPNNEDEIWFGIFIGNYDKGGHYVSLDLQFYPPWEPIESPDTKFILPVFNTLNILEMSGQNYGRMFLNDTLEAEFIIPTGIENKQLYFTTTGHGGWGGGDEFNPKLNQVFIDGIEVFKIVPWRTDCGTYRMSNPASGNFGNGLSSSDLSRSNWCPATLTPPFIIPLQDLAPGKHKIEVVIDMGKPEGNSWSAWNVSGIITGTVNPK